MQEKRTQNRSLAKPSAKTARGESPPKGDQATKKVR
jgi:hypothetical protein